MVEYCDGFETLLDPARPLPRSIFRARARNEPRWTLSFGRVTPALRIIHGPMIENIDILQLDHPHFEVHPILT